MHATLTKGVPILERMSFLTPSPADDDPPSVDHPSAASAWTTSPGAGAGTGSGSDALTPLDPGAGEQFSHGGLDAADPWDERTPWYHAIWPWGMGGLVETLDVLILALAMFLCVRFVAHNYIVDGASMVPTFHDSDFVIVNRLAYREYDLSWLPGVEEDDWRPFGTPQPGDVIVFAYQENPQERDFIKRVIAVPGQTVEVRDGVTYVDGEALEEPYVAQEPTYDYPPTEVEPGTLFVLGDNRNNSFDSHAFGPIPADTVVGRADLRYWPLNRWWLVDHEVGDSLNTAQRAGGGLAAAWW